VAVDVVLVWFVYMDRQLGRGSPPSLLGRTAEGVPNRNRLVSVGPYRYRYFAPSQHVRLGRVKKDPSSPASSSHLVSCVFIQIHYISIQKNRGEMYSFEI
jgi:hypothetical protein